MSSNNIDIDIDRVMRALGSTSTVLVDRVIAAVLAAAPTPPRDPTAYVVSAIRSDLDLYLPTRDA